MNLKSGVKRSKFISAIIFANLLIGCATPYQAEGLRGGYSETQLNENVFRVSFKGNGFTGSEKAADLALLRSAEIAISNGFSHFVIVDGSSDVSLNSYTTPTQSYTTANATAFGNYAYGTATTITSGGQTFITSKPKTTNTIMCFKGKPDISGMVYDANFVCNSVGGKYGVACKVGASSSQSGYAGETVGCQTNADCKDGRSCRSIGNMSTECR